MTDADVEREARQIVRDCPHRDAWVCCWTCALEAIAAALSARAPEPEASSPASPDAIQQAQAIVAALDEHEYLHPNLTDRARADAIEVVAALATAVPEAQPRVAPIPRAEDDWPMDLPRVVATLTRERDLARIALRDSIDAFLDDECDCDRFGHAEDCPATNMAAGAKKRQALLLDVARAARTRLHLHDGITHSHDTGPVDGCSQCEALARLDAAWPGWRER